MIKEKIANSIELLTLLGSIFVAIFLILFIAMILTGKKSKLYDEIIKYISKNFLALGFIVSTIATLGSLFYSEIMGYNPCLLCWYQRIFMYPQPFLFFIAMVKKDRRMIITNTLLLSVLGAIIAAYHYLGQIGIMSLETCDIVGYSAKCSEFFSLSYGFITIPMMALIAFAMIIIFGVSRSFLRD